MASKIRIRLDNVEVEYEGEHAFLATELLPMVEKLLSLSPKAGAGARKGEETVHRQTHTHTDDNVGTLNTLAAKLKPASGPDLILAALYHLAKSDQQSSASRQEILDRMKTASGYYKKSYASNMSNSLRDLVKANKIRETAKHTYSLASGTTDELEAKLAQT